MSKKQVLIDLVCNFIYTNIIWRESQFYKLAMNNNRFNILTNDLKNIDAMKGLIAFSTTQSMNNIYKDLVTKTNKDQKTFEILQEMTKLSKCSVICLLNLINNCSLLTHKKIKRDILIVDSIDNYLKSVSDQLVVMTSDIGYCIESRICNMCIIEGIENRDASKPYFTLESALEIMSR